ncbi:hypothetical protein AAC387_Pa12g0408 [Persea americana]
MRSRRIEGSGGGGIRIRSPLPSKARDHHRSDWHPDPYREERFNPPLERQRPSRRALSSGERRSASVERRGFPGHFDFDGGRDDSGVQIHPRPLDESFPFQESSHSDYRHRYFDVDIEEKPNSKHVGVSSIGGGSSVGKAAKDKGFLGYGSSGFDGLTKNSLGLDDGMTRSFMLPSDPGYSPSLGFNPSKIGGSSTYPSTSSSFGGNLQTGISEDHRIRFHDRLASSKPPTRETYEEEDKQGMMYSRDVSYPLLSSSSVSQSKAFGPASGSLARDNLFSSYGDSLNLQSVGGFGGTSGKFMDSLDSGGHGVGRKLFDCPMNGPDMELKDVKPYRRSLLSPSRDEPHAYSFLELDERDRGGSRFLSDEPYKTMRPSARGNYSLRDPLVSTFTGPIRDRIDATDSSRGNQRETVGSLWDHQKDDPITSYHDVNRGMPLTVDRLGEPFNPGDTHLEFVTKVTRDHDFMHSGGDDYGYGRDVGSMAYRERLKSPPLSDHDPELDLDTQRRSNVEGLGVYDPSERTVKRKYVIDEMNGHDSRSAIARSTSRHFQKRNGKDEHEKWVGKDQVGLFASKRLGFGRFPYRMPGKSYSGSHKISSAWLPSKNVPLRMRAVGMQDASMKRQLRPGAPEFHGSFGKRHNFNRPHKFQKGYLDDRHGGVNLQDEDKAPVVKTDPPQGSEEFKQQVQRAFLRFSKQLNENLVQQRRYREQGKAGSLLCFPCGSLSKEFVDTHSLVTHAFNSSKVGLKTDHLGLHKALCVMMGWNSLMAPDNARAYQSIPAAEASALKEDLILWPPLIVIHNSSIGKKNAGEQVVITNERMEEILREMGFRAGSKVCRGKPANHSILVVKFLPTFSGLQEAERLHKYYAENKRGRKEFHQIASDDCISSGKVREAPVGKVEELLLYGYMGIAEDLDKLDFETKKRSLVKSRKEIEAIADASLN